MNKFNLKWRHTETESSRDAETSATTITVKKTFVADFMMKDNCILLCQRKTSCYLTKEDSKVDNFETVSANA